MNPHIVAIVSIFLVSGLMLLGIGTACTTPDPAPIPTSAPASTIADSLAATPDLAPTPTVGPTPTLTDTNQHSTSTSRPPTAPTFTPVAPTPTTRPSPSPTPHSGTHPYPASDERLRATPNPIASLETPTPTRGPTRTPHATSTPQPPSPLAGLENGNWLEQNKRARAAEIRQLEWVADGVDDSEKDAAELLIAAARWYPDVFRALIEKPWVQDSITAAEADAISRLRWMPRYTPGQVDQVLVMPWVQDDISRDEATIIQSLYWISRPNDEAFKEHVTDAAIDILSMPFLESIHGPDAPAVRSLQRLERVDSAGFLEVMAHPKVVDGISDEEAKVVALLGGTYPYRPQSVDFLLGGTGVYLEERVIELPLTGETLLAIIRIRDQVTPNMDFLEHSVRTIEQFMNEPLPTNYVALVWYFDDVKATAGANQYWRYPNMRTGSKLDVLRGDIERDGPSMLSRLRHSMIAHEGGPLLLAIPPELTNGNLGWNRGSSDDLLGQSVSENARTVDKRCRGRQQIL